MSTTMTRDSVKIKNRVEEQRRAGKNPRDKRESTDPRPKSDVTVRRGNRRDAFPKSRSTKTAMRVDPQPTRKSKPHAQPASSKPVRRRRIAWLSWFFESQAMEKSLALSGWAVALIMILPFGCDLICGWPFWHASKLFDISNVVCGLGFAYLCWNTTRDFR